MFIIIEYHVKTYHHAVLYNKKTSTFFQDNNIGTDSKTGTAGLSSTNLPLLS